MSAKPQSSNYFYGVNSVGGCFSAQEGATWAARPRKSLTNTPNSAEPASHPLYDVLSKQKQQFADAAGNVYLEGPGLLVFVTGRRPQADQVAPHAGKAHTMTGLKVTFALLCDPVLANAPNRAIAATADVALGAVTVVLADLQQTGHLLVLAKRRRLNATKRLLDEWALAYGRRLRAKTLQAIYVVKDFDTWPQWQLDAPALWGESRLRICWSPTCVRACSRSMPTNFFPCCRPRHGMSKVRLADANGAVLEWRKPFWRGSSRRSAARHCASRAGIRRLAGNRRRPLH